MADRMIIRDILNYDPDTGIFVWKSRPASMFPDERAAKIWNTRFAGKQAGRLKQSGYSEISIHSVKYYSHRLAFLLMEGEWPSGDVDHVNQDKADNRWANLRHATRSQNNANRGKQINNSSGYKGVTFHRGKWRAKIKHGGHHIDLGRYESKEQASHAYIAAANKMYGEFANQ